MKISPIRTEKDYKSCLERASTLVDRTDKESLDELEILQALVEKWEREHFEFRAPTPLEAIRFRMEQSGLKPRDLEPYIGSRARVSEVLSGKRQLSIDMIRALHQHLGIPAACLIAPVQSAAPAVSASPSMPAVKKLREIGAMKLRESFPAFVERAFGGAGATALLRKTRTERTNAKTDQAALAAWCAAVMLRADEIAIRNVKKLENKAAAARQLAKLSTRPKGPLEARKELARMGIILIKMDHLPGTYLDGAAMCRSDGIPIIALTLRHDRVDNFWFTLLHEFCHATKHLQEGRSLIIDDLDLKSSDELENEADSFAQEALIPSHIWQSAVSAKLRIKDVKRVAEQAGVHPAIVAGRWQRENNDFRRFSKMLGRGEVRAQFESPARDP